MKLLLRKPNKYAFGSFLIYTIAVICCLWIIPEAQFSTLLLYMWMLTLSLGLISIYSLKVNEPKNPFFLWMGLIVFGAIMSFRAQTGIDDSIYMNYFQLAGGTSLFRFLALSGMEIGYKTVLWLLYYLTAGNYNITQLIITYFSFFMFGKTMLRIQDSNNLPIFALFLWTHYYFLIMGAGLVRIFIAIPIVLYSLQFLSTNTKKYILGIIAASLFHMSALIMLILLLLKCNKQWFFRYWGVTIGIFAVCIPVIFILVVKLLVPLLGTRYAQYGVLGSFSLSIGSFDTAPVFIMGLFYKNSVPEEHRERYIISMVLVALSVIFSVSSSLVTFGRLIFYANLGIPLLVSQIFCIKPKNSIQSVIRTTLLIYAFVYFMYTGVMNVSHIEYLFPYKTFLVM